MNEIEEAWHLSCLNSCALIRWKVGAPDLRRATNNYRQSYVTLPSCRPSYYASFTRQKKSSLVSARMAILSVLVFLSFQAQAGNYESAVLTNYTWRGQGPVSDLSAELLAPTHQ